jgi:hypothetical protein
MSTEDTGKTAIQQLVDNPEMAARAEELVTGSVKMFAALQKAMPNSFADIADVMQSAIASLDLEFDDNEILALHLAAAIKLLAEQ